MTLLVPIKLDSLHVASRTVGLTPHHVGEIVDPLFETRVPPSEDGEMHHTFLVGQRDDTGSALPSMLPRLGSVAVPTFSGVPADIGPPF